MEEHKRRKRYSGKYPKKYEEKYKELNPEKYSDISEHVKSKGNTPAGTHIPIMVKEVLEALEIKKGMIGVDATLGYGGHSKEFLKALDGDGHLYAFDIDALEIIKTKERLNKLGYGDDILTVINDNFKNIDKNLGDIKIDFLMADLGVSSMQIDNPSRGFSYKTNGPLDLRLNQEEGIPASQRLLELNEKEIEEMLIINSDEPYAKKVAQEISRKKSTGGINTTKDLYEVVVRALSFLKDSPEKKEKIKKCCQRVFQAIRIDVNSELVVLEEFLQKLPNILNSNAHVAILTFHSGEDRLVKKYFKEYFNAGIFTYITKDVIRPTQEECYNNPRSKSTKLRWAIMK